MNLKCEDPTYYVETHESCGPTLEETETLVKISNHRQMKIPLGYYVVLSMRDSSSIVVHAIEPPLPRSYLPYEEVSHPPLASAIPISSILIHSSYL